MFLWAVCAIGMGLALYTDEDSNWHCLLQQFGPPRSKLWRAKAKAKKHFLSGSPFFGATFIPLQVLSETFALVHSIGRNPRFFAANAPQNDKWALFCHPELVEGSRYFISRLMQRYPYYFLSILKIVCVSLPPPPGLGPPANKCIFFL